MPTVTVSNWQNLVDGIVDFLEIVGQEAVIQTRELLPPQQNEVDSEIEFTTFATVEKMAFDTEAGQTTFDGTDTERVFSDTAYMEYISGVTSEMFVLFQNKRFRILSVENIGRINGILALKLSETGSADNESSQS